MDQSEHMHLPQFFQDTDYTCGPTSLQMALAYYNIRLSEKHLGHEMHVSHAIGTRHHAMIEAARHHGLHVYANDESSLAEVTYLLELRKPVIIHFIEHTMNWGHYALIHGIDPEHIHLSDPWFGKKLQYPRKEFLARWKSEDGKHPAWLMALSQEPFRLGRTYEPHTHA